MHPHPVLRRIYAARGVQCAQELNYSLECLSPAAQLQGMGTAVDLLSHAIRHDQRILIVGNFNADGATACALGVRVLRRFGARQVEYLVPDRFRFGYGLSAELVRVAQARRPELLVTVDNGISSLEGVRLARDCGMKVLITDHHLPGIELPAAHAIVNPNQQGDRSAAEHLAGVGVLFSIMIALRARLRGQGWFDRQGIGDTNLAHVLDLVALGTVADMVRLDHNNRIMVQQGLARIRAGRCCQGIRALLTVARCRAESLTAADLGYAVAPRLNAAGRLENMSLGIACLLEDDPGKTQEIAQRLDKLNRERRRIQQEMEDSARHAPALSAQQVREAAGLCVYDRSWHQGVVGLLAFTLKERHRLPTFAFAPSGDGTTLKGSGRSVAGLNLRAVLQEIATTCPQLPMRFGGHAMAVGLTLSEASLASFRQTFETALHQRRAEGVFGPEGIVDDGELQEEELTLELAETLQRAGPWGSGFPVPQFSGTFKVAAWHPVNGGHLRLQLRHGARTIPAIAFRHEAEAWLAEGAEVQAVYRLEVDEHASERSLQLVIESLRHKPDYP